MGKITLITGGARSGKSTFAQELAEISGLRVAYLATARSLDAEIGARVEKHRRERPTGWITLETPVRVAQTWLHENPSVEIALLDCITMLVTNLVLDTSPDPDHPNEAAAARAVEEEIGALIQLLTRGRMGWIVVTNEVGLGLVPLYPLGRLFRDLLGWANQRLAANADEIYFMVAGIPLPVHPHREIRPRQAD